MSHIGEANKMVSDTPICDSTPHNVADLGMLCRRFERFAVGREAYIKQLESNNDAANAEIERLTNKVAELYEGAEEQNQRINRLEDIINRASSRFFRDGSNGMVAIGMLNILEEVRKL